MSAIHYADYYSPLNTNLSSWLTEECFILIVLQQSCEIIAC